MALVLCLKKNEYLKKMNTHWYHVPGSIASALGLTRVLVHHIVQQVHHGRGISAPYQGKKCQGKKKKENAHHIVQQAHQHKF